jgi:hypothetical protein
MEKGHGWRHPARLLTLVGAGSVPQRSPTGLGGYQRSLTSAFHEALVAPVEGVPEGRLRRAGCPPGLSGWLSVVVGALGGCQVAIADASGMPGRPGFRRRRRGTAVASVAQRQGSQSSERGGQLGGPRPAALQAHSDAAGVADHRAAICHSRHRSVLGSATASAPSSSRVCAQPTRSQAIKTSSSQTALRRAGRTAGCEAPWPCRSGCGLLRGRAGDGAAPAGSRQDRPGR